MLELIGHHIIQFIGSTSYFGIFLLMAVESALIPIPSEVTMSFSGYLAQQGTLNLWAVILVGTVGNIVGSLVCYWIGYALEETVLLNLIRKYGKFILISEKEYNHASHWFQKYGDKIIFASRLLPGIRTIISLPAGMFQMNLKKFLLYTTVGCLIWSAFLAYLGYVLGANWKSIDPYYQKLDVVVVIGLAVLILWYIDHKLHLRKRLLGK